MTLSLCGDDSLVLDVSCTSNGKHHQLPALAKVESGRMQAGAKVVAKVIFDDVTPGGHLTPPACSIYVKGLYVKGVVGGFPSTCLMSIFVYTPLCNFAFDSMVI